MQNPALPLSNRELPETKLSKRHPRAEWTTEERHAWEQGMLEAAVIAQAEGNFALVERISQAIADGPY